MVHADASNFGQEVSKEQAYEQILSQAEALCEGQRNWVKSLVCERLLHIAQITGAFTYGAASNASNTASLLWHAFHALPAPSNHVNWAGFYVLDKSSKKPQLILGPFQGKVACQVIAFGKGVCGTAAAQRNTQLVPDVEQFPGHIACDGDSKSEIVVPILVADKCVAIIDIDCTVENGFDHEDQHYLEKLARLLAMACDWDRN